MKNILLVYFIFLSGLSYGGRGVDTGTPKKTIFNMAHHYYVTFPNSGEYRPNEADSSQLIMDVNLPSSLRKYVISTYRPSIPGFQVCAVKDINRVRDRMYLMMASCLGYDNSEENHDFHFEFMVNSVHSIPSTFK